MNTGEVLNTLIHHNEAVLHLRFCNGLMVTCSKDRSIAVWDMASPTDISLRRVLVGHRAAVNVVDFDDKYIVSASGDRTIKASFLHGLLDQWFPTLVLRDPPVLHVFRCFPAPTHLIQMNGHKQASAELDNNPFI